jgi:hypothetical protein
MRAQRPYRARAEKPAEFHPWFSVFGVWVFVLSTGAAVDPLPPITPSSGAAATGGFFFDAKVISFYVPEIKKKSVVHGVWNPMVWLELLRRVSAGDRR